jgi:Zn-dependent peptidase ImmA (M78 family)
VKLYEFDRPENPTNAFVKKHIGWVADQLGIKKLPKIVFLEQPKTTSFGTYVPDESCIYLVTGSRHPVDVLRTLAHELTHYQQDQQGRLYPGAGETGTDEENEANSQAGVILRDFNQENPEYLKQ